MNIDDGMLIGKGGLFETEKQAMRDKQGDEIVRQHIKTIEANRKTIAQECAELRKDMPRRGNTKSGEMKLTGRIPTDIYYNNPHLFGEKVPTEEFEKNIRLFFQAFPEFRVGTL